MESKVKIIEDEVFETTYQIVIGDMSVEMLLNRKPTTNLLYNPFDLTNKAFLLLLDDLIEHYIDTEEYLKCAKLRDIKAAKDSHDDIINDIILDVYEEDVEFYPEYEPQDPSPLGKIIDSIKNIDPKLFSKGFKNFIKSESIDDITDAEMWAIMNSEDKSIFKNSFADFYKWVSMLSEEIRDVYIDRLLDDKPLIPVDNISEKMKEEYLEDDIEFTDDKENIDYVNNVVISFLDKYTIMSHTNLEKLKEIKGSLIMHGILDIEMRKKGDVHSLVYKSSQKPHPPNLN
tara:strand:- start:22 stop:882 length:861 start_codon:yes stop_codon:yes gene_type:complete